VQKSKLPQLSAAPGARTTPLERPSSNTRGAGSQRARRPEPAAGLLGADPPDQQTRPRPRQTPKPRFIPPGGAGRKGLPRRMHTPRRAKPGTSPKPTLHELVLRGFRIPLISDQLQREKLNFLRNPWVSRAVIYRYRPSAGARVQHPQGLSPWPRSLLQPSSLQPGTGHASSQESCSAAGHARRAVLSSAKPQTPRKRKDGESGSSVLGLAFWLPKQKQPL